MKRILGITTAALMGASVLAAPAFAQVDGVNPTPGEHGAGETTPTPEATMPDATMPDVDPGTTAAIGGSFDGALTAIGDSSMSAQSIGAMTDVETVTVVSVGELDGSDPALIDQAVSQNVEGVEELRASIQANATLNEELQANGVDVSSVIGAQVEADGGLTVYTM
jgi:hypothetical protein